MTRITLIRILVLIVLMTVPVAGVAAVSQPVSSPPPPGQTDSGLAAVVGPVASKISYQGRLVDGAGVPLSGNYNLVFQLWNDASAGSQVGGDIVKNSVPVSNGLLAVNLDVPQDAFDGQALWLRIQVNGQWLSPRQALLPTAYALGLKPGARVLGNSGGATLTVANTGTGAAITGQGSAGNGVRGESATANGVLGVNTTSGNYAELGRTTEAIHAVGFGNSTGVYAQAGSGNAVAGESSTGIGILGVNSSSGNYAELGQTTEAIHAVGFGNSTGVYAQAGGGNAVTGSSSTGIGVLGVNTTSGNYVELARTDMAMHVVAFNGVAIYAQGLVAVDGTTRTGVLQITGGSDLAEWFTVEGGAAVEPGTLLVIDEAHLGRLRTSDTAYDSKVAGVASGAGDVQPGLTLQQDGVMDGDTLVAIAGRVYVKAEAFSAPIQPGDLLTSSNRPGYAMKAADRDLAVGTVIGKAMSGLPQGAGLVLVLVNLQ